jgi:F-type H+-transporting ATPase subunit b
LEGLSELINPRFLLSQLVNFLILFLALYFLLWKRALKAFDERKRKIAQGLEQAEKAEQKLAEAEQAYAQRVEDAKRESEQLLAAARQEADQSRDEIVAAARAEAQRIVAGAEDTVELERQQMLSGVRDQVAALSIAAANKVIGEAMDEERQRRLIDEFFSGVSAGRVQVASEAEMAGADAEAAAVSVVSALPLSADEQATVTGELAAQLGGDPEVDFSVDPAILGGLRIQVGDRIIDGSVAGRLDALGQSLRA